MKKQITDEDFNKKIYNVIFSINEDEVVSEIINELVSRGFQRGVASDIMEGNIPINQIRKIESQVLMDSIYTVTKINNMNLEMYLEDMDVTRIRHYKIITLEEGVKSSQLHLTI